MIGQVFDNGERILNEATITLILKKGKDLEEVRSYRPISLLNKDQKILTKTLAKRLNLLTGKLVHPNYYITTPMLKYRQTRLSSNFKLHRGARQGCTLSPLLFVLAIEPFADNIRSHPEINGYNTKYKVHISTTNIGYFSSVID